MRKLINYIFNYTADCLNFKHVGSNVQLETKQYEIQRQITQIIEHL